LRRGGPGRRMALHARNSKRLAPQISRAKPAIVSGRSLADTQAAAARLARLDDRWICNDGGAINRTSGIVGLPDATPIGFDRRPAA
jgi:hypothetical protein